jgi:hypothetical protein
MEYIFPLVYPLFSLLCQDPRHSQDREGNAYCTSDFGQATPLRSIRAPVQSKRSFTNFEWSTGKPVRLLNVYTSIQFVNRTFPKSPAGTERFSCVCGRTKKGKPANLPTVTRAGHPSRCPVVVSDASSVTRPTQRDWRCGVRWVTLRCSLLHFK